jgi:hypothetical protein
VSVNNQPKEIAMNAVIKTVSILSLTVVGISTATAQVYQFSEINPSFSVMVGSDNTAGLLTMSNSSISSTLTINQAASTIENAGFVTIAGSTTTLSYEQSQTLKPMFPNPPQTITGDATVTFSLSGGTFAFDTGAQPLSYQGGSIWGFGGSVGVDVPIDISYSLMTGGQTYSGSLETYVAAILNPGSMIDVANYPGSILLLQNGGPLISSGGPQGIPFVSLTAADGFLFGAGVAPEPSSLVLLVVGGLCVAWLFRRRNRLGTLAPANN